MKKCLIPLLFLFAISGNLLLAQSNSRSGFPAPKESKALLRGFPCGGNVLFEQNFEGDTLPTDWQKLDLDGLSPRDEILFLIPEGGWNSIIDFKDSTNRAMASVSWYKDTIGTSDDYLISAQIQNLPDHVCLSWYAYSQDKNYPESYEVLISTTTPDVAGFMANPALASIAEEGSILNYRSVSLEDYAGEDIYLGFRHTSEDQFILVLDDIRLSEVTPSDIAFYDVPEVAPDTGESVFFSGSIINQGLSTFSFDTTLMIHYQVDNEAVQTIAINRIFDFVPNDTIQFRHDSAWIPALNKVYEFHLWMTGYTDDISANDSIGRWIGVGTFTGIEPGYLLPDFKTYPNPTSGLLSLDFSSSGWHGQKGHIWIRDLNGRLVIQKDLFLGGVQHVDLSLVADGLYFLEVRDDNQGIRTQKILKSQ